MSFPQWSSGNVTIGTKVMVPDSPGEWEVQPRNPEGDVVLCCPNCKTGLNVSPHYQVNVVNGTLKTGAKPKKKKKRKGAW